MHELALHPDGRLFVADTFNSRVRVIDLNTGLLSTLGDGELEFAEPHTVALHPDGKRLLVSDLKSYQVKEIELATNTMRAVAGNGKKGVPEDGAEAVGAPLLAPRAAIYGAGGDSIYIASREGHALRRVGADGKIRTVVNSAGKKGAAGDDGPGVDAQLNGPKHLCLDPDGDIVISDDNNHTLRLYKVKEKTIHLLAGRPGKAGERLGATPLETLLNRPHGARYAPDGSLWIADSFNHRLLRFD